MKRIVPITTHLTVLLVLALYLALPLASPMKFPREIFVLSAWQCGISLVGFYLNIYLVVPKTLLKGNSAIFILLFLALIGVMTVFSYLLCIIFDVDKYLRLQSDWMNDYSNFKVVNTFIQAIVGFLLLVIGTSLRTGDQLLAEKLHKQELEKEKISTELLFLKAQINPHFFFNVLHSIYALTEVNVTLAQDAVYTLSQMMRYVLYDAKHHYTTLGKELNFIENYIKLMKLRINGCTTIVFSKPERDLEIPLSPMLLLPFVENAFKHGTSNTHRGKIEIIVKIEYGQFQLLVTNPLLTKNSKDLEESNGIGLANTRRRLDLLHPGNYHLSAGEINEGRDYQVNLKIKLL